jgi:hypothetical protein
MSSVWQGDMCATITLVSPDGELGAFCYMADRDEENDFGDRVWDNMSDSEIIYEMTDRATEQVRIMYPECTIKEIKVEV